MEQGFVGAMGELQARVTSETADKVNIELSKLDKSKQQEAQAAADGLAQLRIELVASRYSLRAAQAENSDYAQEVTRSLSLMYIYDNLSQLE